MIFQHNQRKFFGKLSALGLVEVLVVLAIVGTTMVAAMQLATNSFVSIRDNQITDVATGILIQGLEIAKSPQDVRLTNEFGGVLDVEGSYWVNLTANPPVLWQESRSITDVITGCEKDSTYFMEINENVLGVTPQVCLQIIIEEGDNRGTVFYKVTSRVHYLTSRGGFTRTIQGYRRDNFEI